jgi:hypothetical protein
MKKKLTPFMGIMVLIVAILTLTVLGCSQQAYPPAQTAAPAGSGQTPAPLTSAQMPAPAGSAQMPAPAGTAPTTQGLTPTKDFNQVLVGMTPEQVQQIMGSPEQLYQKGFIEWKYTTPAGKVDVRFQNNKVILVEKY